MRSLIAVSILAMAAWGGESSPLRIVASTPSLASIAQRIGGDRVRAEAICQPDQDPHFVEVKPSYVMRVRKALMIVKIGLELDPWMDALVEQAGNRSVLKGRPGHVDASLGIQALDVPVVVDRSQGDVHPFGNPHYWLDPANGGRIAQTLCDALCDVDPEGAGAYRKNLDAFQKTLNEKLRAWEERLEPCRGCCLITYHRSWSYFMNRFGLKVPIELEPKPGLPPSAAHLESVVRTAKASSACCIVQEPFQPEKPGRFVSEKAGIPLLVLHTEPAPDEGIADYLALFDKAVEALAKACGP